MKKIIGFIFVGIICISLFGCGNSSISVENNNSNEANKVYWYKTDNNTVLHLTSKLSNNSNNKWNNDYLKLCTSIVEDTYIVSKEKINNLGDYDDIIKLSDYNESKGYEKKDRSNYKNDGYKIVERKTLFNDIKQVVVDDVIKLNDYSSFFSQFTSLEKIINLNNINTSVATSLFEMFNECENLLTLDLSSFDTKNVISMSNMFCCCENLTSLNLSNFNTEKVEDMSRMFSECYKLNNIDVGTFKTSNVKDFRYMFCACEELSNIDVSNFNTCSAKRMDGMFYGCKNLDVIDLSSFDFSNIELSSYGPNNYTVAGINEMFCGCNNLKTIYSGQDVQVSGNYEKTIVFNECYALVGGNGTKYNENLTDISFAVIDTDIQAGYFTYDKSKYKWVDGKYYINDVLQTNRWLVDGQDKYYADENGNILKNCWKNDCYLGNDGKMYRNTYTPDNKFVNSYGKVVDIKKDFDSIKNDEVSPNTWYRTDNGIWYYFENDRTTLKKGWFEDPQDKQTYYLDPDTGIMATGWKEIDGGKYYFNEKPAATPNWYYDISSDTWQSYGKRIKSFGSMFKDEITPDGIIVGSDGKVSDVSLLNSINNINNSQLSNDVHENNKNKYEDIYLDIKQNKKTTIQNENEYVPTTLNEAEAKFDEEGNLWITYYNYTSMMRDLLILYQDGTKSDYTTFSPHGDEIFYEANINEERIDESDKAKILYDDMMSKYNNMSDSYKK